MPESHEAADDQNLHRAERGKACAGFHDECANLMDSVEAGLALQAELQLSPASTTWAIENFSDLEPPAAMLAAVTMFEQDERQFDSDYNIATDDPGFIRADIEALMIEQMRITRNHTTTGQIDDGVPTKVRAEVGEEAAGLKQERKLEAAQSEMQQAKALLAPRHNNDVSNAEKAEAQTEELRDLQITFDQLRGDGMEAVEALHHVIKKAKNPETQKHLNTLLGRVALLQTAIPDKPEVVDRLLNKAGLNLAATNVAGSFAEFLTAAETDQALTDDDRTILRQVIQREGRNARTGTQVQTELSQTVTDENGHTVPAHPEDKPYQFRDQVAGFTEADGSQKLRAIATHGERVTLDITGWGGADIGRASELLQLWAMTENEGQTDYLTSITKLNWTDAARIDPITLRQSAQIVSALLGLGEGHDGDIFRGDEALGLIRWQAQLANTTGGTIRGQRDAERTNDVLMGLGIRDKNGNLDLDVLRAFGEYSRDHWMTVPNYEAMRQHLSEVHA